MEPLFVADFSDDNGAPSLDGFIIENTGGTVTGLWHLSTGRGNDAGHSAPDSIYFGTRESSTGGGDYDMGHTAGHVTSPLIDLSGLDSAELAFNYFLETEGFNGYDVATAKISVSGESFQTLPVTIDDSGLVFVTAQVDLSGYVGNEIQLRFAFDTVDNVSNYWEGWYLDDVMVQGTRDNQAPTDIYLSNDTIVQNQPGASVGQLTVVDPNTSDTHTFTVVEPKQLELGDMNLNGLLDAAGSNGDVAAFHLALNDPPAYLTQFGVDVATVLHRADANGDGLLTIDDGSDFLKRHGHWSADMDLDGQVNAADFSTLALNWLQSDRTFATGDTNFDGIVGVRDFSNLALYWNLDAPAPTPTVNRFEIVDSQLKLIDGISANAENESLIDLEITATDVTGLGFSKSFTITVVEENDPASLTGTVYEDTDGNGQQGSGEGGLANWTVYLDANNNSQLDSGETSTTSDASGSYAFSGLSANDYRIGQVVSEGWQQTEPSSSGQLSRIINGTPTSDFSSVGTIGASGFDFCSGTLIAEQFVLTAAHCAEGVSNTEGNFTVGGQTYTTSTVHMHPEWSYFDFGTDLANDIAIYELSQAVNGIIPSPIFTDTPQVGDTLTLVGFGAGGDGNTGHNGDYGTKRVGTTPIDQVSGTLIHWNFDDNTESNTAPGDSGGSAFLLVDGVYQVAGVTSGGDQANAGIGDHSYDTRVDAYESWITSITGGTGGGGTPNDGFYEVSLAAGQTIVGLDFGNQQTGTNPQPESGYQIEVVFVDSSLSTAQQAVFTTAASRWSEVITDDVPDVNVPGVGLVDNLLIYASAPNIDGVGGILGQAGPTDFRSSWLPSSGVMQFDSADVAQLEADGDFIDVILHEMGHVLGIGTIWSELGLLSGAGGFDPQFTGAAATAAYNEMFGLSESSVPVANTGGPGTADAHWRESVFANELMTGYLDFGNNPLSRLTIGSLTDLGYVVNLDAADAYTPPSAASSSQIARLDFQTTSRLSYLLLPPAIEDVTLRDAVFQGFPLGTVSLSQTATFHQEAAVVHLSDFTPEVAYHQRVDSLFDTSTARHASAWGPFWLEPRLGEQPTREAEDCLEYVDGDLSLAGDWSDPLIS